MPVLVEWGNPEKTYTLFTFEGQWTWQEYHEARDKAFALVKDCPYAVNLLIDMTNCKLFPQNMLSHFGSSMQHVPKQFDLAVVVTSSMFIETISRMINTLYGSRAKSQFVTAKTLEDGRMILARHDAKMAAKSGPAQQR